MSIDDQLKTVFSNVFSIPVDEINDKSSPDNVASWDSIRHMTMILSLEEEFNVSFSDEQSTEMLNFGLVKLVLEEVLESRAG